MAALETGGDFWRNELVRLRALEMSDSGVLHENAYDSEARFFLYGEIPFPKSLRDFEDFVSQCRNLRYDSPNLHFAVANQDDEMVGLIRMDAMDEKNGTFGAGIQIWKSCANRGYGTAAMQILFKYGFLERRMNKFSEIVLDGNVASKRMMEKLGCTREGIRRQQIFSGGRYYDEWLYGLLRSEYMANRGEGTE